ncbi:MAG TPA: M17 family peptidase N-terminal domain-containing protein, partial [Methylotenera sp.]|nr:M17 family peptidase N-terminal domain-containing protein [Methylotenera sp.]
MEFSIKTGSTEKQHHNCVIVGIYESHQLSESAKAIDELSSGYLSNIIKRGDLDGKAEKTLMLHNVP